ncbi:MAG: hypothetical protein A2W91_09890 [Bacteroidetes bacterium GWF2_38_335]|nr:MAG: hypothetical protein A2W91_09890 [Bacteroidetes bacterium GWF2_38_335]HBS88062.1 hypothetical protein [Bacteroidales bacterium]
MKLENYKKDAQYFTGKLSDINRYLAFVGIGIIWIFRTDLNGVKVFPEEYIIQRELILPLGLFIISLLLDFIQYTYSSVVWSIFYRIHEKRKRKNPDDYLIDDIKAPSYLSNISYICFFYPKIIVNFIGYVYLMGYIFKGLYIYL